MDERTAIATIAEHADELRSRDVGRLYLFGSTARDEAQRKSDVDIFDLKRGARFSLFDLMDLREYLSALLGTKAGVISRDGLHRAIHASVSRETIRAI